MAFLRAGIPAALLALILLAPAAGAQSTLPSNPLDIFKNRRQTVVDSSATVQRPLSHAAPPPATIALPVRPLRLPGATASLGDSVRTVLASLGVFATAQPSEGGQLYSAGVTWFGEPARAKLRFVDGRLAQAEFDVDQPNEAWVRFVGDELRRQGYRRACRTLDDRQSDCTWSGRTEMWLQTDEAKVSARIDVPADRRVPPPSDSSTAVLAAAPAVLGDTLFLDRATASGHSAPMFDKVPTPKFPDAARKAGVQGIVRVLALVDESGAVIDTHVVNSIPELDAAALETATRYHFKPYPDQNRPTRFHVVIPVRFLLY